MQQVTPFVLYGLLGCQHCEDAVKYLGSTGVPVSVIIANGDVIADTGIREIVKQQTNDPEAKSQYPVLLYRLVEPAEVVIGFKKEEYERLARAFYSRTSSGSPGIFVS